MPMRPQTSASLADAIAMGVARVGINNNTLYAPNGDVMAPAGPIQTLTPTTGQTVAVTNDDNSGTLYLTPAGTLAALTLNLPANANSVPGQVETVITTQAVTALSVQQVGGGVTIINPITALVAGQTVLFRKVAANTWVRS